MDLRDDYSASQVKGFGCGFWALWALTTMAAGLLGQVTGMVVMDVVLPEGADTTTLMLVGAAAGAFMGLIVGLVQGLFLLRYIKPAGLREWVAAGALGGVLRWALLGPLAIVMTLNMDTGFPVCNVLIPLMLYSALSGAVFGLPQAVVLRRHLGEVSTLDTAAWVLANAGGGVFYMPVVMLSGWTASAALAMDGLVSSERFWPAVAAVAVNWLLSGLFTGLVLRDRLRYKLRPSFLEFSDPV